jgi:beta-glucosidase-like glycosyl hydrolase
MGGATAMPAPVAAAATFDPTIERDYGTVVGSEAHTKGVSVNLGPNLNLERDPRGGRVFEGAGEDPYLAGAMSTSYVQGVQAQGVMADIKHFVANDTEQNRNNGNAIVDERTLNEIYYPAFKQAIQQGHAASIMAATSLINGVHDNENAYLLKQTAKQDWGFDGFVVTDWDGARSTVQAANAELDLTMPAPGNFGQPLSDAVRAGTVSMAVLNDKVVRLLSEEFAYGLFDHAAGSPGAVATTPAHVQTAQDIAAEGTVLLKNQGAMLPLNPTTPPSIAVIGEAAKAAPITGGGGSSHVPVNPASVVNIVDGLNTRLGSAGQVDYFNGWNATAFSSGGGDPSAMLDGDPNTRWSSGTPMAPDQNQYVTVDMASSQKIDQITLDSGTSTGDYARGYQVYLSNDGTSWGSAVAAGSPTTSPIVIGFPEQTARYVKVVQTGSSSSWWSIAEFKAADKNAAGVEVTLPRPTGVHVPAVNDTLPTVPAGPFTTAGQPGLKAEYFNNLTLSGKPVFTQTQPNLDAHFTAAPGPGVNAAGFSVRWTGSFTVPVTGTYTFSMKNTGGVRMSIDGQSVFNDWAQYGPGVSAIHLTAGTAHAITVENYQPINSATGPVAGTLTSPPTNGYLTLGWQQPDTAAIAAAAAAAKQASVAVVVVNDDESEDGDRQNLTLPGAQDDLVAAVAKANPNTVVVLNTGGPVLMPWLGSVRGVLESWYGGQQNGAALAAVLFGDVDPSGKLPQTWPANMAQMPTADPSRYPGSVDVSTNTTNYHYSEGLDVGYRWYDANNLTPLFPFGYGLTYSRFLFSALSVSPRVATTSGQLKVSANVTNVGARAASEVAQLYIGDPASAGEPPKRLQGFQRVTLNPGQSQRVTFTVAPSDLATWDSTTHAWRNNAGTYHILVGDSSRNLPLTATYTLTQSTGARTVVADAPSSLAPAHANMVTTTLTAGGTQTLRALRLGLDLPAGWTATALTPTFFPTAAPQDRPQTTWLVTPPAGAQNRLWRLAATAQDARGYSVSKGLQVTVAPLVTAKLSSTAKVMSAGTTVGVLLTLHNEADRTATVDYQVTAAAGLIVTPAQSSVVLPAGATVSTQLAVSVGTSARSASLDLTGTTTMDSQTYPLDGTSLNLPLLFASLTGAYNNTGISDDASPTTGNFDGHGFSYSAQSLAGVGLTPGQPVVHGDLTYTWPAVASGKPDNVLSDGQLIAVGKSGSKLSILGSASNGSGTGTGTITYTDGTSTPFTLALNNWTSSTLLPQDELVATAPLWNRPPNSGYPQTIPVSVYSTTIPLTSSKTIEYLTLPTTVTGDQAGTQLHLFDLVVK